MKRGFHRKYSQNLYITLISNLSQRYNKRFNSFQKKREQSIIKF